jgi:hypothetical protein
MWASGFPSHPRRWFSIIVYHHQWYVADAEQHFYLPAPEMALSSDSAVTPLPQNLLTKKPGPNIV